jgi:ABC-type multidrug transport system fused ATPase/permease subunit
MILVLDRGELVEQGTHAELQRKRGLYQRLYEAQSLRHLRETERVDPE